MLVLLEYRANICKGENHALHGGGFGRRSVCVGVCVCVCVSFLCLFVFVVSCVHECLQASFSLQYTVVHLPIDQPSFHTFPLSHPLHYHTAQTLQHVTPHNTQHRPPSHTPPSQYQTPPSQHLTAQTLCNTLYSGAQYTLQHVTRCNTLHAARHDINCCCAASAGGWLSIALCRECNKMAR